MIDWNQYIKIPREAVPTAVRAAYRLSVPVGLGHLHFRPGELPDESLKKILETIDLPGSIYRSVIHMDYIHGRCCKFHIFANSEEDRSYYIRPDWLDHTEEDLVQLLTEVGISDPAAEINRAKKMSVLR